MRIQIIIECVKICRFSFSSANPSVYTNGYCYLDWIAEQYNMKVRWQLISQLGNRTLLCATTKMSPNLIFKLSWALRKSAWGRIQSEEMITIKWSYLNDPEFLVRHFSYSWTNCGMKIQPMSKKIPVSVHSSSPIQGTTVNRSNPSNSVYLKQ